MIDVKKAVEDRYKEDEPELAPIERTTLEVKELATYLNISRDFVYKLAREKKIPTIRIGARIMFRKETIDRWLAELEKESYEM